MAFCLEELMLSVGAAWLCHVPSSFIVHRAAPLSSSRSSAMEIRLVPSVSAQVGSSRFLKVPPKCR